MAKAAGKQVRHNRLRLYRPYTKQQEFHAAGATFRERLLMAGNQLGKTICGGFEAAMHVTGRYPEGWPGKVFRRRTVGWAAGVTGESTRDTVQRVLLGRPNEWGTGSIPKESILDMSMARGVADLVDTITIRHESGEASLIGLKSYEKGREKWQGETLDWVWNDEEPPEDIYSEGLTRTNATGGIVWTTFTPLKGMSEVVRRFLMETSPDRHITQMTIDDALHYTPEERARISASYPLHEREARSKGIPIMGSGRVFPIAEEDIVCAPFEIPSHWPQIGCIDFGWDHPFAACRLAFDTDSDRVYVTAEYAKRESTPVIHAAAIKPWGSWLPIAWPHDGLQHDKQSGLPLADQYRKQGLNLLEEKATFEDGSNSVEAGIFEMLDRMQTGRWKVFSTCGGWLEEFRMYHRKDGLIVKLMDDRISASRYGLMMRRHAAIHYKPRPNRSALGGDSSWMR